MKYAPYSHSDGTNCWTEHCSRRNSSQEGLRKMINAEFESIKISSTSANLKAKITPRMLELAEDFIPRELDNYHARYYAQTDAKHFSDLSSPGSKFTDAGVNNLNDLLALKIAQDGLKSITGISDDREELIRAGGDAEGFQEGSQYFMVKVSGTVGVIKSSELANDDLVTIERTKDGVPCSVVTQVLTKPVTDYGVIIMSNHTVTGNLFVVTAFPGAVTKVVKNDQIDALEGQQVTVKDVKAILGENFWCNTKLIH